MSMSINSTGSPAPRTSYSRSTPFTFTLSIRPPRLPGLGSSNQMREHDRYGGNTPGYEADTERARDAAARGEWEEAFDLFMKADAGSALRPADLPLLGEVAYAAGHLDVTIETWERAHAAGVEACDDVAAGGAAVRVAMHLLLDTALMAPVRGWLGRAE